MGKPIIIVQGGQYGSEAKGAIAAHICLTEKVDVAVRTGATNAGHTAYYTRRNNADETTLSYGREPIKVVMQQLPVGWVNPDTNLVLGAGALIDPAILTKEVALVSDLTGYDVRERLLIDHRAGVHLPAHAERSKESGRHHKIGATGKGCSEALIDKIRGRGEGYKVFGETEHAAGYKVIDTAKALNDAYDSGQKILLEGTQGTLLDLHLGPYPFTTHKQTGPAVWMAECGLSPALPTDIVMVVRTYPIRVAGNSGPMPNEISWPWLANEINTKRRSSRLPDLVDEEAIHMFEHAVREAAKNFATPGYSDGTDQYSWSAGDRETYKKALSEINAEAIKLLPSDTVKELTKLFELTTVTKKLRRVANISPLQLARAAKLVRPHRVALTFMNYEYPEYWYSPPAFPLPAAVAAYVQHISDACYGAPVTMTTWGPAEEHILDVANR